MKKMKPRIYFTLITVLALFLSNSIFAQSWESVVQEEKGDTLVVKGYLATKGIFNTLYIAIMGDTASDGSRKNPNRVYETVPDEVYITDVTAEFDATVPDVRIVAPNWRGKGIRPPLHIRTVKVDGRFDKTFFQTPGNLYCSNQYFLLALTDDNLDREFARSQGTDGRFEYDNCIFELTNWVMHFPRAKHQTFKFTNNLFINVGNEPTLEKGLVFDSWNVPDTLWFENNTFLNGGGLSIGRPNVAPSFAYYNHNTIINCAMPPFLYNTQAEMVVANNLMVNVGLIADYPNFYTFYEDPDQLPKGIINTDTVEAAWISTHWPDGYPVASEADRKILVDRNNAWWDSRFQTMLSNMPKSDTMDVTWRSQMIRMNSRTTEMFADDAAYPYFTEGTWYNVEPDFTRNKDLVDEWSQFIITNSTPGAPGGGNKCPWWRTNMTKNIITPDWPPLAVLDYHDTTLKRGALNEYPLGDLNWFGPYKEEWLKTNESKVLIAALKAGEVPVSTQIVGLNKITVDKVKNLEVYPNPTSGSATVKFNIAKSSNMDLFIYNLLGEMVYIKELGHRPSGTNVISLESHDLNPGMYIITLRNDSNDLVGSIKFSIQ